MLGSSKQLITDSQRYFNAAYQQASCQQVNDSFGSLIQYQEDRPLINIAQSKFKIGDKLRCLNNHPEYTCRLAKDRPWIVTEINTNGRTELLRIADNAYGTVSYQDDYFELWDKKEINENETNKETNMLTEIAGDMKKFVKEHKSVIYWVAVLLLVDHVFFQGAFKEKLKNMMSKLVGKAENKLNDITEKI